MTFVNLYHPISPYDVWVEEHECPGNVDKHFYMVKLDDCRGRISDKDQLQHLLKAICQALIGDKRTELKNFNELATAGLAGYTVKDCWGTYFCVDGRFPSSLFDLESYHYEITSTNGENEPEQPVTITAEEYERLLADSRKLAAIKGELEGEA